MHFGGLINRKDGTMKKGRILIILVMAALMLLPACDTKPASDSKVSPDWDSEKLGFKTPFDNKEEFEKGEDGKTIDFTWERFNHPDIDNWLEGATPHLIVRGTVLGFDFGEYGEDGKTALYTMYHIDPSEILRGTLKPTEDGLLNVFVFGGQNDNHMFYRNCAILTVGEEYVFLLYDPILDGQSPDSNNAGYYSSFPIGDPITYLVTEENGETVLQPYFEGDMGGEISYDDLKEKVDSITSDIPIPTDSEMRKKYVDRWRYTIDVYVSDGRMTQEEYDEAKAWLDAYESYTD